MTKQNALMSKLSKSLDKANTKKPPKAQGRPPIPRGGCTKLSVSLFEKDMEQLKGIQVALANNGFPMLSTSQALKVALRCADLETVVHRAGEILQSLKAEDGRAKW